MYHTTANFDIFFFGNQMYEHLSFQEHSEFFQMFCFISLDILCQSSWTNCLARRAKSARCPCLHRYQSMDMTILQVCIMNVERHHIYNFCKQRRSANIINIRKYILLSKTIQSCSFNNKSYFCDLILVAVIVTVIMMQIQKLRRFW